VPNASASPSGEGIPVRAASPSGEGQRLYTSGIVTNNP
jgi:hypothetical protein